MAEMQDPGQNDYNRGGMIAFIFSMVVTLLYFAYVSFFSGGIDLKEVTPATDGAAQTLAQSAETAEKPVDISGIKDPWMAQPEVIAHGKAVFKTNCALCHGNEGKGDGPAGMALNPKPRNFVEGKWKKGGTSLGIFGVIAEGLPPSAMQSYKATLSVSDRWSLVAYIRSITQNKVANNDEELNKIAPTLK